MTITAVTSCLPIRTVLAKTRTGVNEHAWLYAPTEEDAEKTFRILYPDLEIVRITQWSGNPRFNRSIIFKYKEETIARLREAINRPANNRGH